MSDSQQYEKVSVSSDGVTVDKRFEEDEFPVPAIAFEITSERTVTVSLTLVDDVPEDVAVEDLGFHPEYGSEYWTIDEDEITFEREIEADSQYTTVYGIRATGTDNVEQFLSEPRIEAVDPPLDDAENLVEGGGSDVVRDVISGDSDGVPGIDDEEDVETLDLKDPNEPDEPETDASEASTDSETDDESATLAEGDIDAGTLCGALAAEIRDGNVDKEDVELLRKAFDLAGEDTGSVDARINRLQTEVADLLAYTDALEQFLDENGTGDELIEEFRDEVETFQSDLEEIRSLAEGHEETLTSLESNLSEVESSMDSLESNMEDVLEDVSSVESEVEEVSGDVDDVSSQVEEVDSDVAEVSDEVDDLSEDIEDLSDRVGDIDVEDVEDEIDDIHDDIEELNEWREQLSSVIGGE
jgi:methyl-accepting chemotaxis protein